MNKIFKVIWNEARNAYVVVSEIAKNHGSKSCSTKKLLAMLIATGVMTCASFDVLAEQPAADKTYAQQYVALKAADFPNGRPNKWNPDTYKHFNSYDDAKAEWDAQKRREKQIGNYTYTLDENKYWVRKGYVLTVDENGGKYTPLSENAIRADVAYKDGVAEGILQSVTSTVAHNGVVTHSGDSLQKITAGSYAGVSHGGGTEVVGSWNYIINDSSWENSDAEYKDGYVDLIGNKMPKGFKTIGYGLEWDTAKQTYTYKGKAVDYRNMYVIDGELGVFTNADGSEVYTGTVYGKNNEILMTVKDNGKFYSYWAASVTDPSATMETYPVSKYNSDLAVIDQNIKNLNKDIIKEVTLTKDTNSAIIRLVRNGGNAVDGAITVTSGGGTGGSGADNDTFVKISNGTTEQTFATGSKVEAIVDKGATTGIKINGEDYTIKSGSKVSVTKNAAEKTTTITVDGTETTITDTDTTYTKGDGIEISGANAISVSKNLTGMQSIKGAGGTINLVGSAITVNETTFNKDGRIQNVANGTETKDAVNFGQLQEVSNVANAGWNVSTNGGTATNVAPGARVDFSGAKDASGYQNIQVTNDGTNVKVALNKELTGLTSVTTNNAYVTNVDASKNESVTNVEYVKNQIADAALSAGDGISITDKKINVKLKEGEQNLVVNQDGLSLNTTLNGMAAINGAGGTINLAGDAITVNQNTFNKDGRIQNVANGTEKTDAVNYGQLQEVSNVANAGWNVSTNGGTATNVAPGAKVDFSGAKDASGYQNIQVTNDGTNVKVALNKELKDLTSVTTNNAYVTNVDASKNESVTNVEYVKNQIADAALSAGEGISITEKKINVKLKDGEQNLVVNQDGLSLNTTLNGMEAINGVGGGKISFSGGNVTINNNVTFNKDGRIQNVTAGTENTDAVNYGQLQAVKNELIASDKDTHIDTSEEYNVGANNQIKLDVLDKDGKKLDQQVVINDVAKASDVGDVSKIADDLKNGGNKPTTVVDAVNNLNNKVGDLNYVEGGKGNYVTNGETTTTSIGKLDKALKDVADTAAKQHTTVSGSGNIVVEDPTTNTDGGKNYNVKLADNITVNSVTANTFKADQTVMDKDGLKVGDKVSVTATAVTAGKTSISDEGVKVGDKTYISSDGLNANGQHITNVKAGEADTDAVNYGQLKDTNNRINGVENQVISNSNRINQLGSRVNKVGAGAAALAALHPMDFDPDDKLTFSAGYGNYGGENAAAIGAYYRPDEKVMFSVGGTVGNGENMVNAGISFALDRTNHVSNSRTALAREVIDLRGQLAVMGAKMAKMEKALGMLDETKTKLFPDIPANHWAYEYIAKLAGNGYIEGYPDGNFGGDRLMTRYEFAAMLYRAIENGAALEEKIIKEFEPELGRIRVDRISGEDGDRDKIERVRVNDTKGERDHYGNKLAK